MYESSNIKKIRKYIWVRAVIEETSPLTKENKNERWTRTLVWVL